MEQGYYLDLDLDQVNQEEEEEDVEEVEEEEEEPKCDPPYVISKIQSSSRMEDLQKICMSLTLF